MLRLPPGRAYDCRPDGAAVPSLCSVALRRRQGALKFIHSVESGAWKMKIISRQKHRPNGDSYDLPDFCDCTCAGGCFLTNPAHFYQQAVPDGTI
jgi:hypothetical protein